MFEVETDVSRASELLRQMNDEGVTVKLMAVHTGYSYQQTWKFLAGEANPTPEFLNRLFVATGDLRIVGLITMGRPCFFHLCDLPHPTVRTAEFLHETIEQRQKDIDCERYVLQILADGKISETDRPAVEAYNKSFYEAIKHAFIIHDSLVEEFEKSAGKP